MNEFTRKDFALLVALIDERMTTSQQKAQEAYRMSDHGSAEYWREQYEEAEDVKQKLLNGGVDAIQRGD